MKYALAISAGLAALNAFLVGYPGDLVPQYIVLGLGAANAVVAAMTAVLAKG